MEYSDVLATMFEEVETLFQPQQQQRQVKSQNLLQNSTTGLFQLTTNPAQIYRDFKSFDSPLLSAIQNSPSDSPMITPELLYINTPSMATMSPQMNQMNGLVSPFIRQLSFHDEKSLKQQFKNHDRVLRNRQAAELSRRRKKECLRQLEEETRSTIEQNKALKAKIRELKLTM